MATNQGFIPCSETHPTSGEKCTLDTAHVQNSDVRRKQHITVSGMKWPMLTELDPVEGFNDFVTFRQ